MLNVALLWHMHQPYYVNPVTRTAMMPWVRLHAVKGYFDMISMAARHPEVKMVFNLTPVLVKQIRELVQGEVKDLWEEWSKIPPEDLSMENKKNLLEHFFKANWDNLITPHPRYHELLARRGYNISHVPLDSMIGSFSKQDYLDLQVWFNLAWCGYAAQKEFPILKELKAKGRHFTEEDKQAVLAIHRKILGIVLSRYQALTADGRVELSTSPFFHPISPLIYDSDFTHRAMPMASLPPRFNWPEDIESHLRLAMKQHEEVFGKPPSGLWPSEGSVCPELIPIWQRLGLKWFATDEDILFRSLARESGHVFERVQLYEPYEAQWEGAGIHAVFRDRSLSDFVGFSAAKNLPQDAAGFIMRHIHGIASATTSRPDPIVAIVLDGENAWEYFSDGGEAFLDSWYTELEKQPQWKLATLAEYSSRPMQKHKLSQLHSGSWIQGNFDIWIGDPEENRAWELLGETRRWWEKHKESVKPEIAQKVWMEIYAAEGSDWFWWYGPDFQTDNDLLFDELFRTHLQNVYRLCNEIPPESLGWPVCRPAEHHLTALDPSGLVSPVLDGILTNYFEWYEAGRYDPGQAHGTMFQGEKILKTIFYGADLKTFFLRLDPLPDAIRHAHLRVHLQLDGRESLDYDWSPATGSITPFGDRTEKLSQVFFKKIVEVGVPLEGVQLKAGDRLRFQIFISRCNTDASLTQLEAHPANGWLEFSIPGERQAAENWSAW